MAPCICLIVSLWNQTALTASHGQTQSVGKYGKLKRITCLLIQKISETTLWRGSPNNWYYWKGTENWGDPQPHLLRWAKREGKTILCQWKNKSCTLWMTWEWMWGSSLKKRKSRYHNGQQDMWSNSQKRINKSKESLPILYINTALGKRNLIWSHQPQSCQTIFILLFDYFRFFITPYFSILSQYQIWFPNNHNVQRSSFMGAYQ